MITIDRIEFLKALKVSLEVNGGLKNSTSANTEWVGRTGLIIDKHKFFVYASDGILFVKMEVPINFEQGNWINVGDGIVPYLLATSYKEDAVKQLIKTLESFEGQDSVEFFSHNPGKFYINDSPSWEHEMCFGHHRFSGRLFERYSELSTNKTCKNGFLWNYKVLEKIGKLSAILEKNLFWYFPSTKDKEPTHMFESEDGTVSGYVVPMIVENFSKKEKCQKIDTTEDEFDDI